MLAGKLPESEIFREYFPSSIALYIKFTLITVNAMMNFKDDPRVVLTLDAGGTNMVFGAMKGGGFIVEPMTLPAHSDNLDLCLGTIVKGFRAVVNRLDSKPSAISFAFPGPADYPNGIIGGYLPNFPSFRDGVALGPFLEKIFSVPVFINNDGDLFAYGEAIGGLLPEVNDKLEMSGSSKRYRNLIGYTFGTGLGIGIVVNGQLNRGDNSCVETFCLPHRDDKDMIVEDGVAIKAIKRIYGELSGNPAHKFEPKDIFDIAEDKMSGDKEAAKKTFAEIGAAAGDVMATAASLIDGLIVIGGGVTASHKYFMPSLLEALRGKIHTFKGEETGRVQSEIYNLDEPEEFAVFAKGSQRKLKVYGFNDEVVYDPQKRIGVAISKLGASKAISIGAYTFALDQLDRK